MPRNRDVAVVVVVVVVDIIPVGKAGNFRVLYWSEGKWDI